MLGDFNTSFSIIGRTTRQQISKNIKFNITINQGLTDTFRTFHQTAEYISFSSTIRTYNKIVHILGHKGDISTSKKFNSY